jgi:hypothetical protein
MMMRTKTLFEEGVALIYWLLFSTLKSFAKSNNGALFGILQQVANNSSQLLPVAILETS